MKMGTYFYNNFKFYQIWQIAHLVASKNLQISNNEENLALIFGDLRDLAVFRSQHKHLTLVLWCFETSMTNKQTDNANPRVALFLKMWFVGYKIR